MTRTSLLLLAACGRPPAAPPAAPSAAPAPTAAAPNGDLCPLGAPDTWASCDGKRVQLDGQAPQMVSQHPMMAAPAMGDAPAMHQLYLDTAGVQVVVITAQDPGCAGPMRATGTLQRVDLGGPEGTKESYSGWALQGATVVCG